MNWTAWIIFIIFAGGLFLIIKLGQILNKKNMEEKKYKPNKVKVKKWK